MIGGDCILITLYDDNFYNLENYENELWKEMDEFGSEFLVSNYGRIKRKSRIWYSGRNNSIKKYIKESIVKQRVVTDGYVKTTISYNGIKKSYAVHRLVAKYFIANILNKPEVNHKDGNKTNNMMNNLEWVTKSENMIHSVNVLNNRKGRYCIPPLTKDVANRIRIERNNNPKLSYRILSKMFNCSISQAYNAINKNTYSK